MVFDTAQILDLAKSNWKHMHNGLIVRYLNEKEAIIWMMFVASLWVFNFVLFFTLGKKKTIEAKKMHLNQSGNG
jgi:hypothetical protein